MADVTTETQSATKFDPEAFSMNLARAMQSSGQALAAYLKPRENGEPSATRTVLSHPEPPAPWNQLSLAA